MGQTETALAKFVLDFPTQEVPADVMHLAKRCLMNYSGVALLANLDPAIDILLDVLRAEGCAPAATVIGKGFKTSVQNAALANGFLGHFEDYDDTHTTVIHPSAPILPGALALSEQRTVSGKDFLAAFAVGVEVACRIGLVLVAALSRRRGALAHHQHLRRAWRGGRGRSSAQTQPRVKWSTLSPSPAPRRAVCAKCSAPCASRFTRARRRKTAPWRRCWRSAASPAPTASSKERAAWSA